MRCNTSVHFYILPHPHPPTQVRPLSLTHVKKPKPYNAIPPWWLQTGWFPLILHSIVNPPVLFPECDGLLMRFNEVSRPNLKTRRVTMHWWLRRSFCKCGIFAEAEAIYAILLLARFIGRNGTLGLYHAIFHPSLRIVPTYVQHIGLKLHMNHISTLSKSGQRSSSWGWVVVGWLGVYIWLSLGMRKLKVSPSQSLKSVTIKTRCLIAPCCAHHVLEFHTVCIALVSHRPSHICGQWILLCPIKETIEVLDLLFSDIELYLTLNFLSFIQSLWTSGADCPLDVTCLCSSYLYKHSWGEGGGGIKSNVESPYAGFLLLGWPLYRIASQESLGLCQSLLCPGRGSLLG